LRLYGEFARWFHLLTAPADYAEEAAFYLAEFERAYGTRPAHVLELGSGGGNNASHMKTHCELVLSDLSPQMLELSKTLNPELEHVVGDMRTLRLARSFEAVLIHDAVSYLTSLDDVDAALATAFAHLVPGGVVLLAPDWVRENFRESTGSGGHDGGDRALRYLQWVTDPDPDDTTYQTDFVYMMRENGELSVATDSHTMGLFPRDTWVARLRDAGFESDMRPAPHWDQGPDEPVVFVGVKPR